MRKGFIFLGTIIFTIAVLLVLSQVTSGGRRRLSFDRPSIFSSKKKTGKKNRIFPGLEHRVVYFTEGGMQGECDIFKINQDTFSVTIKNSEDNPRLITGWADDYPLDEGIIVNGAFFLEDFKSCGYLVIKGKLIQPKKVDQDKSGLIVIKNGKVSIRNLSSKPIEKNEHFDYAIQSYPMLIKEGISNIKEDSGLAARRTLLGIDYKDNLYIISLTSYKITLYSLMGILNDTEIPFKHVLNLDGGISSGYYVFAGENSIISDSYGVVPNILLFERK